MDRFLREPPSVRNAIGVIVVATLAVVIVGGVAIRILDHHEYSSIWIGMWWALQTVTTVGYGDLVPAQTSGKIVASVLLLGGLSLLAVVTGVVTSAFVTQAQKERLDAGEDPVMRKLDELTRGLESTREELARLRPDGK